MNETLKRALSGLVYVLLLLFCTIYSQNTFVVLMGIFLLFVAKEFCTINKMKVLLPTIICLSIFFVFNFFVDFTKILMIEFTIIFLSIAISMFLLFWLFSKNFTNFKISTLYLILGLYVLLPFIIICKLPIVNDEFNSSIIISIFILIWTHDTFAYIVGKSIGKTKLLATISPKKTVEGFVGGLLFSIGCSVIIAKFYNVNFDTSSWITIAILVSFLGTIGDLVESKFKRLAQVKDSGNIMPGHGGMLDRLDSIIFVTSFLFLFFKISSYVS